MCFKKAFTLAEVLITLGIIGIVSVMTIPTLVANYNAKQWNISANVFERKFQDALKTMNSQSTLAGHTTTESFVEELSKHFKMNKICTNDNLSGCFSDVIYWGGGEATPEKVDMSIIKYSKNFGQKDWNTNIVGVQFANGVSALIAYNPTSTGDYPCIQDPHSNQVPVENCLAILYDTSGAKNPNTSGKDIRSNFNVARVGSGCSFEIGGTCYVIAPFTPEPHVWNACDENGASTNSADIEFMSKYGLNYCMSSSKGVNDYWAGAVKTCGGTHKMPTLAQLKEIANYVYNGTSYTKLDTEKALSLGFKLSSTNYFYVWSGEEKDATYAHYRYYQDDWSNGNHYYRYGQGHQAICVE